MQKKKSYLLVIIGAFVLCLGLAAPSYAQITVKINHEIQIKHSIEKFGNKKYVTGGLVQTISPTKATTAIQSVTNSGSLGASGKTSTSRKILGIASLPDLWNPLDPDSENYGGTTPVLNQNELSICWDYAGVDAISNGAQKELKMDPAPALLPAYYDYLSAQNAFNDAVNPFAIMETDTEPRQLGDGNTLDYVPVMSILGYNPTEPTGTLTQSMTLALDKPISQKTFDSLTQSNLHVDDTYDLPGLSITQLPTSTTAILNRVNQIKQLVYQYGEVQFGLEAEYSLDNTLNDTTEEPLFSQVTNTGDYTSYTPYTSVNEPSSYFTTKNYPALTTSGYVNADHELEIVGYDDNYSRTNFKQDPGMDGAFIVKNSWGADWGTNGYFYLSYADLFLASSDMIADDVTSTQTGQKTYSATNTSPEASGYYIDFGKNGLSETNNNLFTNTYTSQVVSSNQVEQLDAISAEVLQPGIEVRVLYKAGSVSSTTKVSDFKSLGTYTFTDSGYQTIPFKGVTLGSHTSYTIALQIMNMTSFSDVQVPIQNLENSGSGQYPILTSKNSWIELDNQWENTSSDDAMNFYLDAHTQVVTSHTIIFNSNGGNSLASQKVAEGDSAIQPTNPTKSGYTFSGWYSDSGLTHLYQFGTAVNANTTLYAKWTKITKIPVYRIYNPHSKAHFYTISASEAKADVKAGWKYMTIAWYAPVTGGKAVYRIYNSKSGEHFYTESSSEINKLVKQGWKNEGVSFEAATTGVPVYRLYNAKIKAGSHFYTDNPSEKDSFVKQGWRYEEIAWYGVK